MTRLLPGRLSRTDRRDQLLDTAAELLVETGAAGLTMEGLAERAGVSKALPYNHFENADGVLVALFRREATRITERVATSGDPGWPPAERVAAGLHAYFDVVRERGTVLAQLTAPGSTVPQRAGVGRRSRVVYLAHVLGAVFGLPEERATAIAGVAQGAVDGAVDAWMHGEATRAEAEAMALGTILHLAARATGTAEVGAQRPAPDDGEAVRPVPHHD